MIFVDKLIHRLAVFTTLCTFILIFIGALVKSTESGLAVPDWPTTFGENMFLFPISDMVGGVLYEHSHRLFASFVGLCILILSSLIGFTNQNKTLKIIGWTTLGAVLVQGILGGLTVIFFLPALISISHATLAQITLCLMITITVYTSKRWKEAEIFEISLSHKLWSLITTCTIWVQLLFGSIMRHTESGLAALDFPKMNGKWIPSLSEDTINEINNIRMLIDFENILELEPVSSSQLLIHFIHRLWGYVVLLIVGYFIIKLQKDLSLPSFIKTFSLVLGMLLIIQIVLGAMTILSYKEVFITTLHVTNGAGILGISFYISIWHLRKN